MYVLPKVSITYIDSWLEICAGSLCPRSRYNASDSNPLNIEDESRSGYVTKVLVVHGILRMVKLRQSNPDIT